jgi:hypothetical protein
MAAEFRAKAKEFRQFATSRSVDRWRSSFILSYARDCDALADAYERQCAPATTELKAE